ncbi:MAG: shikimate kinase [Actinomycetota bacterium]|nr:shikimate kinase [Actinomycetota bacterium]
MSGDGGRPHLVLVGLMGAGKTTVGERCAELLARPFVDTDDVITAISRRSVQELFAEAGESIFRELERDAVRDATASPDAAVIACGGGAVLDPDNRRRLRAAGTVVWLRASPAVLAERVDADDTERPLLAPRGAVSTLERLAVVRAAAYEAVADAAVDTDGRTVDEVADAVLEVYRT